MKLRYVLPLVLLMSSAFAQTAKVIELKPDDAAMAKQLHDAARDAQKAADDFDLKVAKKYTWRRGASGAWQVARYGWEWGFEFSEDYRFIVPKPYQNKLSGVGWPESIYDNPTPCGPGCAFTSR